jgi:hypothetical protein
MVYGTTKEEAFLKCKVLALRVLADQIEHNEAEAEVASILFVAA